MAQVKQQLPPTRMILFLVGKEKSRVNYQRGKHSKTAFGQRTICSANLVLRERGTSPITPGTYVFPFEICMPSSIPSSMSGKSKSGYSNWKIQYKMHVCAHGNKGSPVDKLGERYVTMVSAPLPNERVPAHILPKSHRVESFGMKKGTLSIGAKIMDAHVGRGVGLEIFLASRNDATVSVKRVQVCLIEEVRFSAQGHSSSARRAIVELPDIHLPGLVRGKKKKSTNVVRTTGSIIADVDDDDDIGGMYDDLESGVNKIAMPVPWSSLDSYGGALIRIDHYLEITLFTKALVSNPSVKIPIQIGFPPIEPPQTIHVPVAVAAAAAASAPLPIGLLTPLPPPMSSNSAPQQQLFARAQPIPQAFMPPFFDDTNANNNIPFASAVTMIPMDGDAVHAPMASAPLEALVVGGTAAFSDVESSFAPSSAPASLMACKRRK